MASDVSGNYSKAVEEEIENKVFNEERDNEEINLCVLCCSKVKVGQNNVRKTEQVELFDDPLFGNLSVVFLLKKVLQVPDSLMERNLQICGNPENWLILCDQCNELSRRAKELHSQIIKIARQLRFAEQLILDKVKDSLPPLQLTRDSKQPKTKIWSTTRELITNYNYRNPCNIINPFIQGDKLAEKYLKTPQLSSGSTQSPKFEEEPHSDDLDDYGTIWEDAEEEPGPPSTSKIKINQSARLSGRKRTKKVSPAKIQIPSTKPRLKRNQTAHLTMYGKFKCNYCEKLFSSGGACYTHEREKHVDIPAQFNCDLCPKTFNSERFLLLHKRQTHKMKWDGTPVVVKPTNKVYKRTPTICNICGKSVTNLKQHHRSVHEKRVEDFCHVCGKGLKNANNWRHHLLSMHKDDPVTVKMMAEGVTRCKCEVKGCGATFMKKVSLETHVEKVHGNNLGEEGAKMRFNCEICGKGFWKRDKLKRHELIHKDK